MRKRSLLAIGIVVLTLGLCPESVALAACRVKTEAVAANVVAVPVAVSVGVPVAEVAPYYYSYQAAAPQPAAVAVSETAIDEIAARVVEKLRSPSVGSAAAAGPASAPRSAPQMATSLPPISIVAEKCAKCHGGSAPKADLSFENLAALDCESRLKAVRAVLSQKMPKGGPPLSAEEAGKLLEELVGRE
ncbi:MAG TPA: hypothetical protein VKB78_06865 [Pirellulales bacterium]|nr:hypothetical protein [Pirellulales bacterium]